MKFFYAFILTLALSSGLNALDSDLEDEGLVKQASELVWGVCEFLYYGFDVEVIPADIATLFARAKT